MVCSRLKALTFPMVQMSFTKSKNNLEYVVKKSYLDFQEASFDSDDNTLRVKSIDPITGGEVQVNGYLYNNGEIDQLIYRHTGLPSSNTLDDVSISVNLSNPDVFLHVIQEFIETPILVNSTNAQNLANNWSGLQGVSRTPDSDVFVLLGGGELGVFTEGFNNNAIAT